MASFANISETCNYNCPYVDSCHNRQYCVFKEIALIMRSDKNRIAELEESLRLMKVMAKSELEYSQGLERACGDYYEMIHDFNSGINKKVVVAGRRKKASSVNYPPKLRKKDKTIYDGDPKYGIRLSDPPEYTGEEIL